MGPGPRPWQAGPLAWPSLQRTSGARKQRNRFQGNFLSSVSSRVPSPASAGQGGAGLGKSNDPREIPDSPSLPGVREQGGCAGLTGQDGEEATGEFPCGADGVTTPGGGTCFSKGLDVRKEGRSVVPGWLGDVTREFTMGT